MILMPGSTLEESHEYGEALRAAIERNVFVTERLSPGEAPLNIEGVITCSVGIACLEKEEGVGEGDADGLRRMKDRLIRAADSAMYRAKDLGKNRVAVDGDGEAPG